MAGRVAWSDDSTEFFLDICLEMKAGGLSKVNWDRIVSTLNVKSGKNFNIKQARNHWDDLRKRFKIWNEMELNWTGLTFDPITGCPVVEQDDRWNIFVNKYKGMLARFLRRPLPHLEKLRALFSGSFATSKWSFSPGLGGEQIGKENEESSYRNAAGRFQHSIATIGLYFKQVLEAMVHLSTVIIRPYQSLTVVPKKIGDSTKYWPYFKDCVGALDGTHINAVVSDDDGVAHRGRKGKKTWNVLAACSFDRLFTFINVGFEGSAHDITVWNHCLTVPKFRFPHPPPGKYYLVDSGYPNTVGYLSPIKEKDIRTHLPEFRNGPPPQGMLELFNYLHSSLRTTIERCFGQLKGRWKILTMMPQMDTKHQLAIMVATFTLHNFIRLHELDIPIDSGIEIEPRADYDLFNENRKAVMKEVQLNIAKEIWNVL
uniref:DDE Tnp4 domain-containing protein n=1 Tax=Chenopodium quinoa TaxID=63459 RepID=A0A803MLS4_CHEQI